MSRTVRPTEDTAPTAPPTPTDIVVASGETTRHRFSLNHPKNYLGVPIAKAALGDTGGLVIQHLVGMAGEAKRGAAALGLLTQDGDTTERGSQIVAAAKEIHGSPTSALESFADLRGRSGRFINAVPVEWVQTVQSTFLTHPTIRALVQVVPDSVEGYSLPDFTAELAANNPEVAREAVLAPARIDIEDPAAALEDALADDQSLTEACPWLTQTESYRSGTTYQLKSLLCHAGILTEPGVDTSRLAPRNDTWALSPRLSPAVVAANKTHFGDSY